MKGNTQADIDNRKVEKIQITVTIDKPDPMPMLELYEIGRDEKAIVAHNRTHKLLVVYTGQEENNNLTSYVIDVAQIVAGIVAHEEQNK